MPPQKKSCEAFDLATSFLVNQFVVLRSEAREEYAVAVTLIYGNLKNLNIWSSIFHTFPNFAVTN